MALFSKDFFSGSCMILLKNVPEKFPIIVENAWEQRLFTTMQKEGQLILKTPMIVFKIQMRRKKVFFYENVLDLT